MKKRFLSLLLCLVTLLSLCTGFASAASSEEEALGEVNIFNGGTAMSYLSINGRIREQIYTYYNYVSSTGQVKEIPAYCVNPNTKGVPQTVAPGESIEYLAEEKTSDPKVMGIVANGYPTRGLSELKLENKYHAYYATKMALWCYLLPNWDINNLKVNPNLTGVELQRAQAILAAAKNIYVRGTAWSRTQSPRLTSTVDQDTAYPVTINGTKYLQQVFTIKSDTWVCDYDINVSFANPDEVPEGTRLVDTNNNDITAITTSGTGDGYAGQVKVLYPAGSVEGKSGSVQLAFSCNVYQYAIYYAVCAEQGKYGELQNYICDTDPTTPIRLSAQSNYSDEPEDTPDTGLRIIKKETGSEKRLSGALFEVIDPNGASVGTFSSNSSGEVLLDLTLCGNYTVIEREPAPDHLISTPDVQNVNVEYGKVAEVTFYNDAYGSLRVEKRSDTGDLLPGAVVQIRHIESGTTYVQETNFAGCAFFDRIKPGAYEILERTAPVGWLKDDATYNTTVVAGEVSDFLLINRELPGIRIIKYDRKNKVAMPDVTFEIFRDGVSLGRFRTDEFGEILLTDQEPGTYRAVEVDTGDPGLILDATPQEVELQAGDGIRELLFFNDRTPGLRLTKVDSADPSKVIPNAVFEIKAVDGSYGPEEFRTNAKGEIDLTNENLPAGSYVVTEKSCAGYVVDDAQRIVYLGPNVDAEYVFTNSRLPSLLLIKQSSDGTPLEGVSFRLAKIEDGSYYLDRTSGPTGEILWEGLEPGVYSLSEISTRSDHILDLREYHIELFPGKTSTKVLTNDRRSNLYIHKRDGDTSEPIPGTVYLVRGADGHSIAEVETDENGVAVVPNLLPSVVEVIEKSVPEPYLLAEESQLVTMYPNRDRDVYFENFKRPSIEIIKENSVTHDRLSNVRFQVWYASNNTSTGEFNDLGIFTTDENGRIELTGPANGLRDGWFRVKELAPPTGFSIKDSDTQEAFVQAGKGHTFLFENTPLSAICVWKYDSKTGAALSDCWFQVRYLSGNTSGTGGTVIGTYRTSANGSFTVTNCKAGTYIIEELSSDGSHVIDTPPQTVYLSGQEQEVVPVYFGNSPKGAVLVKKVSSADNTPLSDVEFLVTTSDGAVVGDANGKFVTDSAGTFLVENVDPGTTMVIKETRGKSGFLLDDTPQTVQVKAGQTVTVEFRNQPLGNLIIEKLGRNSTKTVPLEGVKFEIKYADGRYVDAAGGTLSSKGIYYTNASGQIILPGITGTVVVTELESVSGYTIDENSRSQTVTVNPNDTQTIRFYNNAVGGVEIIKISSADKTERIPNTTFEIRRVSDDALVDTVTTGKTGSVFVTLPDDSYYAVETESAEGFKLDSTPHYFTVKDGSCPPLTVTNAPISGILIHKVSTADGSGIYGVTFLLYDANKNPIGQYTSDQDGYVYIDDLPGSGRFYLRELENEGYVPDTQLKTVYVTAGTTTEIEWENTPITGQIQVTKTSADYNSMNGWPAGTPIPNTIFEIYNYRTGKLVDTIKTGKNGVAVSKPLPLGRYQVIESQSADFYGLDQTPIDVEIEFAGQIVKAAMTNKSLYTNVSIKKTGYTEVMPGQSIRYDFSGIANNSTTSLTSFYWRDTLPVQAVRLDKIVTGTYNVQGNYKVVFKTNLNGEYRTMYDNLSTMQNYMLDASPAALGLASNEYVTEFMVSFGVVPANFRQVEAPKVYCNVVSWLTGGTQFTNQADAGGVYDGQWIMATTRWVTRAYKPSKPLPRTGY